MQRPRRGVGKRAGGLIVGECFFMAGGLGFVGAGRAGAGMSTLCSGAGGVMSGTLRGCRSLWGRGRLFQDLGDLDVHICDVGAVGQGRDGVGCFFLDEREHVIGCLA